MTVRQPKVIDTAPKVWSASSTTCPVCGSDKVDYQNIEQVDDSVFQKVDCGACGAHWSEEYQLTHADIHDHEFGPVDDPSSTRVPNADSSLLNAAIAVVRLYREWGNNISADINALADILEMYGVEL